MSLLGGSGSAKRADGSSYTVDFIQTDARDHNGVRRTDDPRVGMIGGSYGGQVQFAAASVDARIDTIVPVITWNDLQYSVAPNNTSLSQVVTPATPGTDKMLWSDLFFGVGIVDGLQGVQIDPTRLVGCPNFRDEACAAKAQLDALGYPIQSTIDLTKQTSVAYYAQKIKIPTLLMQGQADTLFNLEEAVVTYRQLKAQGTPVKMIWQSWGHSQSMPAPGEYDGSGNNIEGNYESTRVADWFAHYLKDDTRASTGPEFSYFRPWVNYTGSAAPALSRPPGVRCNQAGSYRTAGDRASGSGRTSPSAGGGQYRRGLPECGNGAAGDSHRGPGPPAETNHPGQLNHCLARSPDVLGRGPNVVAYPVDDVFHRRARREYLRHADLLEFGDVSLRDDAAAEYHYIGGLSLGE